MSSRLKYLAFHARHGLVLMVGIILAGWFIKNDSWGVAIVVGVVAVIAAVVTYVKTDRPVMSSMSDDN